MKFISSPSRHAKSACQHILETGVIAIILATGFASMAVAAPTVTQTNTLTMGAGSKGNLTNGVLIVNTPGASGSMNTAAIIGAVANGFDGGAWDGLGSLTAGNIYSSNAAGNYPMALGYGDNSILNYPTFAGKNTPLNTEVFVKYTYYGDGDLVGGVTGDDFNLFLDGYNGVQPVAWTFGDYDFNGVINADDFNIFLDGYNACQIGGPTPPLLTGGGVGKTSVVPEPSSMGLVALGALGMLARRRRR